MEVEVIYKKGNVANDPSDFIINTVNCVGIMGAGVAKAFKTKFPTMFMDYQKLCADRKIKIGKMSVFIVRNGDKSQCIINFPTKHDWRKPSKLEWIEYGLEDLSDLVLEQKPSTIAMPMLGCGNGGLKWDRVKPLVYQYLVDNRRLLQGEKLTIYIYIPAGKKLMEFYSN